MKTFILALLTVAATAAQAKTVYKCGPLKYKDGSTPVGGPSYNVQLQKDGDVFLKIKPLNPTAKDEKVKAELKSANTELKTYTAKDITIQVISGITGQINVRIEQTNNKDWSAACIKKENED